MTTDTTAAPAAKPLRKSSTVHALITTLVAFLATLVANRYGYEIPADLQAAIVALGVTIAGIYLRRGVEEAATRAPKAGALAVLLALMLSGCCTHAALHAELRDACATYAAANRGHEEDETLPDEARLVAGDNADAWEVQRWRVGGPKPSAEVLTRVGELK